MGLKSNAKAFIAKHGQDAILIVSTGYTVDEYGQTIENPPLEQAITVAIATYSADLIAAYGGLIERDDLRVYLAHDEAINAPTIECKLKIESVEYRIIRVSPFMQQGTPLVYELQVRHG